MRTDAGRREVGVLRRVATTRRSSSVGRGVYIREGCWYCHSQYVRPVTGEDLRWGPVSEAGEYAFDLPHLFSTRRIGPDLTRVGLKYGDDWHYAHHWDPRLVVPDSIMPSFKWLYRTAAVAVVDDGRRAPRSRQRPALRGLLHAEGGPADPALSRTPTGLAFVAPPTDGTWPLDGTPASTSRASTTSPPTWKDVTLVSADAGAGRASSLRPEARDQPGGLARRVRAADPVGVSVMTIPREPGAPDACGARGLRARCVGCHGREGRRQRPGRDLPRSPRPATSRSASSSSARPLGLAADRRRPLSHRDARRALDGHAHVA